MIFFFSCGYVFVQFSYVVLYFSHVNQLLFGALLVYCLTLFFVNVCFCSILYTKVQYAKLLLMSLVISLMLIFSVRGIYNNSLGSESQRGDRNHIWEEVTLTT